MPDKSHLQENKSRALREDEKRIVSALLNSTLGDVSVALGNDLVQDMDDGGMGSIQFLSSPKRLIDFGRTVEAHYTDEDGVLVSISLNRDEQGRACELAFWKVDFSPLRRYPRPDQIDLMP